MDSRSPLSPANQAQVMQIFQEENKKKMLQDVVSKITDVCWEKCITGTPANKFNANESTCLSNCAKRYREMSVLLVQHLQSRSANTLH
ncbi:hypothetical protein ACHQM5_010410 [Ranunculus cassubicifolius]